MKSNEADRVWRAHRGPFVTEPGPPQHEQDPNPERLRTLWGELPMTQRLLCMESKERVLGNVRRYRLEELVTARTGGVFNSASWVLAVTARKVVALQVGAPLLHTFWTSGMSNVRAEGEDLLFTHTDEFDSEEIRFNSIRPREKHEPLAKFLAAQVSDAERERAADIARDWDDALHEDALRAQPITGRSRERISERVRHEVWRRDQGRCAGCGSRERLEFDHIVPVSQGGSNTARNLELLCEPCNRKKGARI